MERTTGIVPCLVAAGLLLAGCGPASPPEAVPIAEEVDAAAGSPSAPASPPASTGATERRDCPDAAVRWGAAGHSPAGPDDWPVPGRFVETSSGTVLEEITASPPPADQTPLAGTRMTPDPSWPRDSVVLIDDTSGEIVRTIDVADDYLCAP